MITHDCASPTGCARFMIKIDFIIITISPCTYNNIAVMNNYLSLVISVRLFIINSISYY